MLLGRQIESAQPFARTVLTVGRRNQATGGGLLQRGLKVEADHQLDLPGREGGDGLAEPGIEEVAGVGVVTDPVEEIEGLGAGFEVQPLGETEGLLETGAEVKERHGPLCIAAQGAEGVVRGGDLLADLRQRQPVAREEAEDAALPAFERAGDVVHPVETDAFGRIATREEGEREAGAPLDDRRDLPAAEEGAGEAAGTGAGEGVDHGRGEVVGEVEVGDSAVQTAVVLGDDVDGVAADIVDGAGPGVGGAEGHLAGDLAVEGELQGVIGAHGGGFEEGDDAGGGVGAEVGGEAVAAVGQAGHGQGDAAGADVAEGGDELGGRQAVVGGEVPLLDVGLAEIRIGDGAVGRVHERAAEEIVHGGVDRDNGADAGRGEAGEADVAGGEGGDEEAVAAAENEGLLRAGGVGEAETGGDAEAGAVVGGEAAVAIGGGAVVFGAGAEVEGKILADAVVGLAVEADFVLLLVEAGVAEDAGIGAGAALEEEFAAIEDELAVAEGAGGGGDLDAAGDDAEFEAMAAAGEGEIVLHLIVVGAGVVAEDGAEGGGAGDAEEADGAVNGGVAEEGGHGPEGDVVAGVVGAGFVDGVGGEGGGEVEGVAVDLIPAGGTGGEDIGGAAEAFGVGVAVAELMLFRSEPVEFAEPGAAGEGFGDAAAIEEGDVGGGGGVGEGIDGEDVAHDGGGAVAFGLGEGGLGDGGVGGALEHPFAVGGEEEAVADDGAGEEAAELVLAEGGSFGVEGVAGVEGVVAEEFVEAAVELVAAAGGDEVDGAAAGATVFGFKVRRLDFDGLEGFLADGLFGEVGAEEGAGVGIVEVGAVDHDVGHALAAAAVDGEGGVGGAADVGAGEEEDLAGVVAAGAAGEGGEILEGLFIEEGAAGGGAEAAGDVVDGLGDGDGAGDGGDGELDIELEGGADGDFESGAFVEGEAGGFDGEVIVAGGEPDEAVVAGVVGGGFAGALAVGEEGTDAGVGDDGAGGVEDGAGDDAIDVLGEGGAGGGEGQEEQVKLHGLRIMHSHYHCKYENRGGQKTVAKYIESALSFHQYIC